MSLVEIGVDFFEAYRKQTSHKLQLIDAYLCYTLVTAMVQFVYVALVGTFPFNSFLAGFISCIGSFVLGVCLRMQVDPSNSMPVSTARAFADFIFGNAILHLVVINFIG